MFLFFDTLVLYLIQAVQNISVNNYLTQYHLLGYNIAHSNFKIKAKALYIINAEHCISSKRSFVYHQVAEEYTFGDDIHAKA
jgi:hypothetical protein